MIRLDNALRAWRSPDFKDTLKQEIESMDAVLLPLQQGLTTGNYAITDHLTAMINSVSEANDHICVTAGIFYMSVTGGCSCADDQAAVNANNEYCTVRLDIDKKTAATTVSLVPE
jgi:hypothetical protein